MFYHQKEGLMALQDFEVVRLSLKRIEVSWAGKHKDFVYKILDV